MPKSASTAASASVVNRTPYLEENGYLTRLAEQQLKNPFEVEDIYWKPTNVKNGKCVALIYADKRTYEERLDLVFGPQNWQEEITKVLTAPYHIIKKAKRKVWNDPESEIIEPEQIIEGHRVMVVVRLSVNGMGFKESSCVSETEDENSIMTAEAQAFKRCCSMYFIGKYFYWLPKYTDCEVAYGKIKNPPSLPEWALPVRICEECVKTIRTTEFKDKENNVLSWNPVEITKRSQANFGRNLCMDCMRKLRVAQTPASTDVRLKPPVAEQEPQAQTTAA